MTPRRYAAIFGVGAVLVVGATLAQNAWFASKDGHIVLFAPADAEVTVTVDGGSPITLGAGEFRRLDVAHGKHVVNVSAPPLQREVDVPDGRSTRAVPLLANQCFVELDVTLSHYGESDGKTRPLPTVSQTFHHDAPFELYAGYPLAENELPKETHDKVRRDGSYASVQLVQLFRTVPCDAMDAGPDATLRALGYG